MNRKHESLLPAMGFVVLLGLQSGVTTVLAQAPVQQQRATLPQIPIKSDTTHTLSKYFTPATSGFNRNNDDPVTPVASQQLADVIKNWPTGNINARIGDYMGRPHQKWTITAAPDSSGYLGGPYYKITIAGTDRTLAATTEGEVITVPTFTGAPEQLWRIDQLTDGTYRIMPKVVPNSNRKLALASSGDSTPTLAEFDMNSDNSKWNFKDR